MRAASVRNWPKVVAPGAKPLAACSAASVKRVWPPIFSVRTAIVAPLSGVAVDMGWSITRSGAGFTVAGAGDNC